MTQHYRTLILIFFALGAIALAYLIGSPDTAVGDPTREMEFPAEIEEIPPEIVASFLKVERVQLVDVRSREEVAISSIPGAIWISLSEIESRATNSQAYPELESEAPVVVYCRSGVRSLAAVRILRCAGFATSYSLAGGIRAWERQGHPIYRGETSK